MRAFRQLLHTSIESGVLGSFNCRAEGEGRRDRHVMVWLYL